MGNGSVMRRKLMDNYSRICERVAAACARFGRRPESVEILAVTKYVSLDVIREMVEAGFTRLCESRPQQLARRAAAIREWLTKRIEQGESAPTAPTWHLIGPLQRNKVRIVLPWAGLIHSVDTLRLAEEIDARSKREGLVASILLEVNATEEPNRHGVAFPACVHLAEVLTGLKHLKLRGLMAMGPNTEDEAALRLVFERISDLFAEIKGRRIGGEDFNTLSMGMSHDFEVAIEYGATHLRIGSALYEGIELAPAEDGETEEEAADEEPADSRALDEERAR